MKKMGGGGLMREFAVRKLLVEMMYRSSDLITRFESCTACKGVGNRCIQNELTERLVDGRGGWLVMDQQPG